MTLTGKRVVITGASRGLGQAFAVACAGAGADVVINGRDSDALAATAQLVTEAGGRCETVIGSIADEAVCEALVGRCLETFDGIDCLVNNAGITRDRTLGKMSAEEFDDVVAVNLRGTWACTRAAALAMRESGGSIVNVVSNSAFSGAIGQTNYAASKAGVAGMTRTWTRELARYSIRVNAIWPIASTDMTAPLIELLTAQRAEAGTAVTGPAELGFGRPEDVAAVVVFLAADESREVNGQIITFNGSKLALWDHPREVVAVHRESWTADEIAAEFSGSLRTQQQTLYEAF